MEKSISHNARAARVPRNETPTKESQEGCMSGAQAVDMHPSQALDDDVWTGYPPYTNRGGKELTPPTHVKFSCCVDYLTVTFRFAEYKSDKIENMYADAQSWRDEYHVIELIKQNLKPIIPHLQWMPNERGMFGYKKSIALYRDGKHSGVIAYEGNSETCMISLSGFGTAGVRMHDLKRFYETLPGIKITRIDLANDDLAGSIGIEKWKQHYQDGDFHIHGRSPSARYIDDFGSGKGKTLYIGRKENGKELCIYEKGRQLGNPESEHVRVEGRFYSGDRNLPLEMMIAPAMYLAGMYPVLRILHAFHEAVEVVKKQFTSSFEQLTRHCRKSYGKLINVMREFGMSPEEICSKLIVDGYPARLVTPLAW